MPPSILEIKDRLVRIINEDGSVRDMALASDAISVLEKMTVTKEELESTRLGLYVNKIRKASKNSPLARRAKNLIISWKKLIDHVTPARIMQQTRPETPNSVGSSPSPPEPHDYGMIRNFSSPQLTSWPHSRSSTPTSDPGVRRSKKHRTTPENAKISRKKDVPDGAVIHKGQSSEVKSEKQALDTGQHTMSVGSNGLKLTFKTQTALQSTANQSKEWSGSNDRSKPSSLKRSLTDSNLSVPHKPHKKKKGHRSPHKTSSPALPTATERINTHQDVYNNNNNETEHRIQSLKSTPNFTVNKTTPEKDFQKISTMKSCNNLICSTTDTTNVNLKRKRDQAQVDTTSPERSSENKPRAPKERRLTYDPVTGQLKQVPSQDKPFSIQPDFVKKTPEKEKITANYTLTAKNTQELFHRANIQNSSIPSTTISTLDEKRDNFGKTAIKTTSVAKTKDSISPQTVISSEPFDDFETVTKEMPTRLSPSVDIMSDSVSSLRRNCSESCGRSNLYKTHREFRKRKTRRKDCNLIDLKTLFPISNVVDTLSSDSDENSDPETSFSASIHVDETPGTTHSQNCVWPGVTGCRGNNGAWYNWMETFCVKNHENSERLPQEEEILPLQILPYVELD